MAAFRRFIALKGRPWGAGTLEIIDADDATMTVECVDGCGECYLVETDAFGDGCLTYYVGFLAQQMKGGDACDT